MKKNAIWLLSNFLLVIVGILSLMTSCGLDERKHEKEVFKEYPTWAGDEMVDISTLRRPDGSVDSAIVVKNEDGYFRIRKDGTREPVKRIRIRR